MSMDFRGIAALLAAQHAVASRRQLAELGLAPHQIAAELRRGHWEAVPGGIIRIAGAPHTWRQQLMEATLYGTIEPSVSHRAAEALQTGEASFELVEVTAKRGSRLSLPGVILHTTNTLDPCDVMFIDSIRVTTPARTLADLGAVRKERAVDQSVESALRRGLSLADLTHTLDRVARPGPSGTGALGRVLSTRSVDDPDVDTWFERLVVRGLSRPDLPTLQTQIKVKVPGRDLPYRIDCGFAPFKVGIEAHSRKWHTGPTKEREDRERHERLLAVGWLLGYVSYEQAKDGDRVRALAQELLRARGWRLAG